MNVGCTRPTEQARCHSFARHLETLKKKLQVWHEQRADNLEAARQARLDAESRRVINVVEYNGEVYLSFDGIPLVDIDYVKMEGGIPWLTEEVRRTYKDWKEEKLWESGTTRGSIRF